MISPLLVRITDPRLALPGFELFSSLEGENPGLSIKDHMVEGELEELQGKGLLGPGARLSEVSAGSTAVSLATWCPRFKVPCDLFLPTGTDPAKVALLRGKKAEVHFAPKETIYQVHEEFSRENGTHSFNQLWDAGKTRHYHSMGERIRRELGPMDAVLGAVGTGHSLRGIAEGLQSGVSCSAEPEAPLKVPGIRNLDEERYGEKDPCRPENFSKRVFVNSSEVFRDDRIRTDQGPVRIGASFQLALGAFLKAHAFLPARVFLVAADSRRC